MPRPCAYGIVERRGNGGLPLPKRERKILYTLILLSLAALLWGWLRAPKNASVVRVRYGDALVFEAPLSTDTTFAFARDGFANTVVIQDGSVYMHSANCPDHNCIQQGAVTPDNLATRPMQNQIVCLPHRLVVSLEEP